MNRQLRNYLNLTVPVAADTRMEDELKLAWLNPAKLPVVRPQVTVTLD